MMIKCSVLLLFLFCCSSLTTAQTFSRLAIDFTMAGQQLLNPLAGGLNSPQPSKVDFDDDGKADLYIFDRVGDHQLAFLNAGTNGEPAYVFAPEYLNNFPVLKEWVLLRDYNGDGIMDIFAYSDLQVDGVRVYTGYYEAGKIAFERYQFDAPLNIIYYPLTSGGQTQLYVSKVDYPAVDDVDCDGDLDIVTFNVVGGKVEWYANKSVEMGYGRDSLIFRLEERCWGGLYESGISNEVDLAETPGQCVVNFTGDEPVEIRHAGSTLLTFDSDNDGDKELVLGDISFTNLNFLHNGGDCEEAWMNEQDPQFPNYDVSVDIAVFPASFYLDVTGDGVKDLMAAPNLSQNGEDYESLWLYENIATNETPNFDLVQKNFLIDGMIDMGSGARPVFVDYNADGLLDLVVGNYSFFEPFGAKNARIYLFENVGTATGPQFVLVDDDYLNMNQFSQNAFGFTPVFADLDGDGDSDVLVGEQYGHLFYGENTAGAGQPFAFTSMQYDYMSINVGQASVPAVVDLNRDGLPDLVVGELNGNINYFQNTGTQTEPFFSADPTVMAWGGVDTRSPGFTMGASSPFVMDFGSDFRLFTGTETGKIEVYSNIDGNLDGTFDLETDAFGEISLGKRSHPTLADIDNNGILDLVVGNFRGGFSIFRTNLDVGGTTVGVRERLPSLQINIYPNPAADFLTVELPPAGGSAYQLELMDATGKVVRTYHTVSSGPFELNLQLIPAGVYLLKVKSEKKIGMKKVMVE